MYVCMYVCMYIYIYTYIYYIYININLYIQRKRHLDILRWLTLDELKCLTKTFQYYASEITVDIYRHSHDIYRLQSHWYGFMQCTS